MGEWNNLSLVSSLMLSIAFESFTGFEDPEISNPDGVEFWGFEATYFIDMLNWVSIICDFVGLYSV